MFSEILKTKISARTVTVARFCIQSVSSSTALQSNTRKRANCVVTPLRIQAIVIINLTFIYIFEMTDKTDS